MPGPTAAEAARLCLTVEEASGAPVEMWPDNEQAVSVFIALSTQWRYGFAGPTGLDYSVIPFVARSCGVARSEMSELLEDIRVLEGAALDAIRETMKDKK